MRRSKRVSVTLIAAMSGVAAWALPETARADEVPIVYSRCPRGHGPFAVTGSLVKNGVTTTQTITLDRGEVVDALPDTANTVRNFVAPCDLVYRDEKGTEKILYSCIDKSTPEDACAALDASVSFDAKTVAFSVFRGPLSRIHGTGSGRVFDDAAENTQSTITVELPSSRLNTKEAQIVLVDVATGRLTPLPHPPESINFGPTWTSDGRIVFSSNRRDAYATMPLCDNNPPRSIQLYSMDPDGRNLEIVTPHAISELHPIQLSDGRIASSSWQVFGMLAYRHGNSFAGCGTTPNFFHAYVYSPDGANENALYGQHLDDPAYSENFETKDATHFFGQTSDGRVWTAEYYRGNNLGIGSIVGFPIPSTGQEGPNATEAAAAKVSTYRVPGQVRLAHWTTSFDAGSRKMPDPPMTIPGYKAPLDKAGKLGHPSGLPGNKLMVSWGVGDCTQNTGMLALDYIGKYQRAHADNPICDVGIYRTEELPTTGTNPVPHPSALIPIVNSPEFHEFMARPVVPYAAIYGIDKPPVIPRAALASDVSLEHGTPFGVLGASSILHRETKSSKPISFEGLQWAYQGTDAIDYSDDDLCGIRVLAVYPNRKIESYWKSSSPPGERLAILGEFPVRKKDGVKDGLGMPDTSFRVRFPADTPVLMQGIDCQGRTLNTDQTWQSMRMGEVKTCNGCHVHSAAATKLPFETTVAAKDPASHTSLLGMGKVPLLTGGAGADVQIREIDGYAYMIEFDADIMPIFERRCVSCHGEDKAQAGLRLDIPRVWEEVEQNKDQSTYKRLALDASQKYVPAERRFKGRGNETVGKPNLSKYVRMMNSRGSLLYWKAANARTDNRTDDQVTDDVDFGPAHPTEITPEELATLARWIDTGAGWGPDFTQDNLFPTLHLVGVGSGSALTALRVGTVDTGAGIEPDSLTVCITPPQGECGPNIAPKAAEAGVVTIPLSPALSDPDTEVVASVKDRAGNVRDVRYTVRYLLSLPPPEVPGGETPGGSSDAPASAASDEADASGCACRLGASRMPSAASYASLLLGVAGVFGWASRRRGSRREERNAQRERGSRG